MKVIEAGWQDYRRQVVPANAGPIQVEECKRAFYAGAVALFSTLVEGVSPDRDEVTPEDEALMESVAAEIADYRDQMALLAVQAHGRA